MTDGYLLNLRAFREVRDDKAQALKPLEEAAEAFGAWQECDDMRFSPIMTARRARSMPPSGAWTRGMRTAGGSRNGGINGYRIAQRR